MSDVPKISTVESSLTKTWTDELDQDIDDALEDADVPKMSDLEKSAQAIQDTLNGKKPETDLSSEKTPTLPRFTFTEGSEEPTEGEANDRHKSSSDKTDLDPDYQESFASQQEAAEIRHNISSLDTRLDHLATLVESMLAERENLPKHLDNLKRELNKQMTTMSDRLNAALEQPLSQELIEETKKGVETLTGESTHVLQQLQTDASNAPNPSSAMSKTEPITKARRRIRIIE